MAQSGYTPIQLYYSTTASTAPTAGNLVAGELAINTNDGKLFYKDSSNVVQVLATGGTAVVGGSNTQVQYNNNGVLAGSANMTFNGSNLTLNNDAYIAGITVGRGAAAAATNTVFGNTALASNTTGTSNSAFGINALTANLGGGSNSAFGVNALGTNTSGDSNSAYGAASLRLNTTGAQNIAIGASALYSNTTASNNTAVGYQAGYSNTTGTTIDAFGYRALFSNTTGVYNSAFGGTDSASNSALYANTTGLANSAFAQGSLGKNTTGSYNSAFGYQALLSNTTASNNTAVGYQAAYSGTGAVNTAIGYQALKSSTANTSTAVGGQALFANTTGEPVDAFGYRALYSNTTGSYNVGIGYASLNSNTTGNYNVAVGPQSLVSNTTASNNTAVGYQALYNNTSSDNTAIGYQAGYSQTNSTYGANLFAGRVAGKNVTTGWGNTLVGGYSSGELITTGTRNTVLGCYNGNQGGLDIRTASNYIVLSDGDGNPRGIFDSTGNFLVAKVTQDLAVVGFQVRADAPGLAQITRSGGEALALNRLASDGSIALFYRQTSQVGSISVTSSATAYNTSSDYRLKENIALMTGALDTVSKLKPVTYKWKADGSEGQGFIAHELAEVVPDCVTGEKDAVDADGKPVYQGIDTSFLVATLTAAIQELKAEFDAYKATHP